MSGWETRLVVLKRSAGEGEREGKRQRRRQRQRLGQRVLGKVRERSLLPRLETREQEVE